MNAGERQAPELELPESDAADRAASDGWISRILWLVLGASVTGAVTLGYHFANENLDANRLFLEDRLNKLYKPLRILSQDNDQAWQTFTRRSWRHKVIIIAGGQIVFFDDKDSPTQEEVQRWRTWEIGVAHPINVQQTQIMTNNAALMPEGELPKLFEQVIHHTESFSVLITQWAHEEAQQNIPTSADANVGYPRYPGGLTDCLNIKINELQTAEKKLSRKWFPWQWISFEPSDKMQLACQLSKTPRKYVGREFPLELSDK